MVFGVSGTTRFPLAAAEPLRAIELLEFQPPNRFQTDSS